MTDKEFVQAKYPGARCLELIANRNRKKGERGKSIRYVIDWLSPKMWETLSGDGRFDTEAAAWASAAERIRKAEEVKP